MLQMAAEAPLKYKPRNVSAIRHFPPGCVPSTVKLDPPPSEGTVSMVFLENGKVTETDKVLTSSNSAETPFAPSPSLEEKGPDIPGLFNGLVHEVAHKPNSPNVLLLENNSEKISETVMLEVQDVMVHKNVLENNVEMNNGTEKQEVHQVSKSCNPERAKVEVQQVMVERSEPSMLHNSYCYSNMGAPRRRKVSAIRQFPTGCGSVSAGSPSLSDKSFAMMKTDGVNKDLAADGSARVVDVESLKGEMGSRESKEMVQEIHLGTKSKPVGIPDITSKKSKSLQQEMTGRSTYFGSTKELLDAEENLSLAKQSTLIDGSAQMKGSENNRNHDRTTAKPARTLDGSSKVSSLEKFGVAHRTDSRVAKDIDLFIEKTMVRSNSDKDFRIQDSSSHVQVKPSLKSGSNKKLLSKGESNELLVRSSSDKTLEGFRTVQTDQNSINSKANANSRLPLVVKSQSEIKRFDKRDTLLMEKTVVKANEVEKRSSKRGWPAETSYKSYSPGEDADSFDTVGERMIVQALMASRNCPWRNSMKHVATSSEISVPKSKVTKEKKRFASKTSTSKNYFSSQFKRKGFSEDADDSMEDDNELSITMFPLVPPNSSLKGGDNEDAVARHKVKRVLRIFQLLCRKFLQGEESRSNKSGKAKRIDLMASAILKDRREWVNCGEPIIGNVPGVEIGDEFHFRVELSIVGLHRPFQGGIDSTKIKGILLATSIVAADGYQDDMDSSDVLIYSGAGGTSVVGGDKQAGDQKLERGNLALKNSIDAHTPVRVIHGFKEKPSDPHDAKGRLVTTYTYDGLYYVEKYWQELGNNGYNVFKFQLRRMAQQPELAFKEVKRLAKLKIREGLCVKDISQGKEKIGISAVNTIDTELPMPFKYITKNIYPSWYAKTTPSGCDCKDGCSDSDKCACAVKNGGEIPFNYNGAIVLAKPLIYECGQSCKCASSCHNRVSQHGIKVQLEIFKTSGRGWGVRSLKSIPSGTFICEYIGELLQDGEAEQRTNDEYLFDIGHNYDDLSLWKDLPNFIPGLLSSTECDTVESEGFTIDAAEFGNVGRFINHSCSPNLYAQNVLYDHNDKRMPHIMFFAADNIPPLQELTYHYNYSIDTVRDSEGNIKQKACHCGSAECCGRLY